MRKTNRCEFRTGNNVQKILDRKGMTAWELSKRADLRDVSISRIANRDSLDGTTLLTLVKMAEALEIPIEDLYRKDYI